MKIGHLILIILAIVVCFNLQGQNQSKLDSLNNALKTAKEDTNKVNIYLGIARQTFNSDIQTAFANGYKAYELAKKISFVSGEAESCNVLGVCHYFVGNLDSSEVFYLRAISLANKYNFKKIQVKCTGNLGLVYTNLGKYDKAIEYINKALKMNEAAGDSGSIARNCADIASVYAYTNKFELSVSYNTRALEIFRKLGMKQGEANVLNSIGSLYQDAKKYKEAKVYFNMSVEIKESIGDLKGLSNTYHNLGTLLMDEYNNDSAMIIFEKAIKINNEIDNKEGLASTLISIGLICSKEGNNRKAIEYYLEAYHLSEKMGFMMHKKVVSMNLAACYDSIGDYKNALFYFRKYKSASDSLKSVEIEKKVTEVEELYQNEKKQKEIELLEKDKELQETEMIRQKTQKYAFVGGFVLMLVIAFLAIMSYRKIRAQKHVILEKNVVLNQQNEEITAQRDEIEAQRDEITVQRDVVILQKDHIEEQKKEIMDSITYAKRIQQAMLPDLNRVLSLQSAAGSLQTDQVIADCGLKTADYFVLFKPKDIVSGDFYWATKINEWLIVTVADCTGHGVPGAFMSMLGVSFLNEIVRKKEVTKASDVLNHLRESIIEALQQKGTSGEQKDGMDIALCVLNTETNVLQFAGANNPLYIVKSQKIAAVAAAGGSEEGERKTAAATAAAAIDGQLTEVKADNQPVAIYENMKPFTYNEIKVNPGDTIYLASDGYEDQFGGPKNKKFMAKKLKELLVSIADKPMHEQQVILNKTFEEWKGGYEQIDDVTVLGLRIN